MQTLQHFWTVKIFLVVQTHRLARIRESVEAKLRMAKEPDCTDRPQRPSRTAHRAQKKVASGTTKATISNHFGSESRLNGDEGHHHGARYKMAQDGTI